MVSNHEEKAPNSEIRDTYFKLCISVLFLLTSKFQQGQRDLFLYFYTQKHYSSTDGVDILNRALRVGVLNTLNLAYSKPVRMSWHSQKKIHPVHFYTVAATSDRIIDKNQL